MAFRISFRNILIIALLFLLHGCGTSTERDYHVITVDNAIWAGNISTSMGFFLSTSESEEQAQTSLVAADGDLLILDEDIYFRYDETEGDLFNLSYDTLNGAGIYMNDKLISFNLTGKESSWKIFDNTPVEALENLKVLQIFGDISEERIRKLKEVETVLQGIGLVMDDSENLEILLDIFNPEWLILEDSIGPVSASLASSLANVELLMTAGENLYSSNLIEYCVNVESLIVIEWYASAGQIMHLIPFSKLNSLTLAYSYMENLSSIEFPNSLSRLHMIAFDSIDISGLAMIPNLTSLSLLGFDDVSNIEIINALPSLKWLSFPPYISQIQFNSILQTHQELNVVELYECEEVTDLTPLGGLLKIKALMIYQPDLDLSQLENLKNPGLLVLNEDVFEDLPDEISSLRAALPDTKIVPGGGLCLGSGWLMLLIPLILLARLRFGYKPK